MRGYKLGKNFEDCLVLVKRLHIEGHNNVAIKNAVRERFKVKLHPKTITNYLLYISKDERVEKYREENKLISKWNETNKVVADPLSVKYAENLSAVFEGRIENSDFERVFGGTKL